MLSSEEFKAFAAEVVPFLHVTSRVEGEHHPKLLEEKGGRGHWGRFYSVVLAGGGIQGGQVFGKSDRFAAYPAANPVAPADVVATAYHALGIESDVEAVDPTGRPVKLCLGSAIRPLFR